MDNFLFNKSLIIGVGLIGSSLARGLKNKKLSKLVFGYDNDNNVKKKCMDLNIVDSVLFTGFLPRNEVINAFNDCDIVVLPSLAEGFGLSITEGMSFGKPVIGSNVGGIPLQIQNDVNGYLITPRDHVQLANALIKVLKNDYLLDKFGNASYLIYKNKFSLEKGLDSILNLYRRLLNNC